MAAVTEELELVAFVGGMVGMISGELNQGHEFSELVNVLHILAFVINLKTAKALGIKIPHELLLRADQVIK
jgi:ABC-type uncharacterized transport system substrate-binding protein